MTTQENLAPDIDKLPLYAKIRNHLLAQIKEGAYEENQLIPTERELCEQFNVSRPTVRQATQELISNGYLTRKKGVGTYVTGKHKVLKRLNSFSDVIKGFTERIKEAGKNPSSKVLKKEIVKAENVEVFIFNKLNLNDQDEVLFLHRLRLVDDIPVLAENVYLPLSRFPGINRFDFNNSSLFAILREEYDCSISGLAQTLKPVLLDHISALLLEGKRGDPAMYATITTYDQDHQPIASSYSISRADQWQYYIEFMPDDGSQTGGSLLEQVGLKVDFQYADRIYD